MLGFSHDCLPSTYGLIRQSRCLRKICQTSKWISSVACGANAMGPGQAGPSVSSAISPSAATTFLDAGLHYSSGQGLLRRGAALTTTAHPGRLSSHSSVTFECLAPPALQPPERQGWGFSQLWVSDNVSCLKIYAANDLQRLSEHSVQKL